MMAECHPISFSARTLAGPLLWMWLCNAVGFGVFSPSLEGLVVYLWHLSHWIPSFLILNVRASHTVFVPSCVCLQLSRILVFICHSCRRMYIDGWPLRFPFRVFFDICPWHYCEHICQAQKESSEEARSACQLTLLYFRFNFSILFPISQILWKYSKMMFYLFVLWIYLTFALINPFVEIE